MTRRVFCRAGGLRTLGIFLGFGLATWLAAGSHLAAAELAATDGKSAVPSSAVTDDDIIAFIDAQIRQGWKDFGVAPSAKAPENEWCRRVYLDLLGRTPTVIELDEFLKSPGPNKKAKLIDKLLGDEKYVQDYARNWTTIYTNMMIGRPQPREDRMPYNREGMQQYLRSSFLRNKPYDQMAFELVSATGATKPGEEGYNGATSFLIGKLQENATEATSRTARYFLGLQVQCTQCHNHPFNDWKQDQFWSMNAFFRQTKMYQQRMGRAVDTAQLVNEDFSGEGSTPSEAEIYFELRNGTMAVAYPTFVDGTKINASGYVKEVNRRAELGKLIIKSEYFGKAIANRLWGHFLGYGFTKPVDDLGPHNLPSHPDLLDRLGVEFASHGHDLKKLMRWITLSEAYSLSSKITGGNKKDDPTLGEKPRFSHFYLRQMEAEQLYESLMAATEAGAGNYEEREAKKAQLLSQFTLTFGNDEGDEATTFNGTIPQVLMMMNGELVKDACSMETGGFLQKLSSMSGSEAVEKMYLATLARKPTGVELGALAAAMRTGGSEAYQDIFWALLNSNEFIFNH